MKKIKPLTIKPPQYEPRMLLSTFFITTKPTMMIAMPRSNFKMPKTMAQMPCPLVTCAILDQRTMWRQKTSDLSQFFAFFELRAAVLSLMMAKRNFKKRNYAFKIRHMLCEFNKSFVFVDHVHSLFLCFSTTDVMNCLSIRIIIIINPTIPHACGLGFFPSLYFKLVNNT